MVGTTTDNRFGPTSFIVDPSAANGAYTTIQSAINAASAGTDIFIRPGTYTENISLKDGVNLSAFTRDPNITIISGTVTMNTAGTVNVSGIQITTNGATAVSFSSANLQNLTFTNCTINGTNANTITNSNSNAGSVLVFETCFITASATYKLFDMSGTGSLGFRRSILTGSSTACTASSGAIGMQQSTSSAIYSLTGTAGITSYGSNFGTANLTVFTLGTGTYTYIYGGRVNSGSAVPFNITSTGFVFCLNASIETSNASSATGTGTFYDGGNAYTSTRNPATSSVVVTNNTLCNGNGTAGQVITSNGANLLPTWQDNTSNFIVDSGGTARYSTIQAAINAASAGDTIFIRPGTYTENISLKNNVNLTAFTNEANYVSILGTVTCSVAAIVTMSGFQFVTNGAAALSLTNAVSQSLTFTNCTFTSTNANLITCSNTGGSGYTFVNCNLTAASTYKFLDQTGSNCTFNFRGGNIGGASTTASTSSAGIINLYQTTLNQIFSITGNTQIYGYGCVINTGNNTFVTLATGTIAYFDACDIATGSGSIFSITSTGAAYAYNCILTSNNASTVTGTGAFYEASNSYRGTRVPASTTKELQNNTYTGFFAQVTGGLTNVTGDGTIYTIIYNNEVQDFGGNYNPATGVYTAPYTGWYQFNASAFLNALTASFTSCAIYLTTPSYEFQANQCNIGAIRNASNQACLQISRTIYMTAGQTCVAKVIVSGSTKTVGFVNDTVSSTFTGKLVLT